MQLSLKFNQSMKIPTLPFWKHTKVTIFISPFGLITFEIFRASGLFFFLLFFFSLLFLFKLNHNHQFFQRSHIHSTACPHLDKCSSSACKHVCICVQTAIWDWSTYAGRVTCVVPTGTISMDFPQNLFFHLTSETGGGKKKKRGLVRGMGESTYIWILLYF